jgi:2'-hydroxyisoflavone reductase
VGAGDASDRFTYWPVRMARGGQVLAPGNPTDPVQFIDARAEMLGGIRATMTTDAWLTWVDTEFLNAQRVRPWSHMPVWIPPVGQSAGFTSRSIAKAVAAGLTFRPLADTVKATLEFYNAQPEARKAELRSGLPAAREKEVLAAWHARPKAP